MNLTAAAAVALFASSVGLAGKADADASYAYAAVYGEVICDVLDEHPTEYGLLGVGEGIVEDGLSYRQAGKAIAIAIQDICPRHMNLLRGFVEETI